MTQPRRPHLVVLEDEMMLAEMLARTFVAEAVDAIAARGLVNVALAGGSTPTRAYRFLAAHYHRQVDWNRVHFFFGDERCVPPGHPDSNYRMARETLLDPLGVAESAVFRMHGEDDPADAAKSYAAVLRRELGTPPAFDLLMLGMGPDGHTASLFPGAPLDDGSGDLVQVRTAPPGARVTQRLTITPAVITAGREIVVAVAGEEKAEVLAHVLDGPNQPDVYPVQIVRTAKGRLTWLVDRAAATRLRPDSPVGTHS